VSYGVVWEYSRHMHCFPRHNGGFPVATARRMVGVFIGTVDGIEANAEVSVIISGEKVLWLIRNEIAIEGTGPAVVGVNEEIFRRVLGLPVESQPTIQDDAQGVDARLVVESNQFQLS